jgi:ketosteroid isomerase-like protein
VSDEETRAKLERHWATAGDRDQEAAHEIYHEDCVVEWPQSGERVRGKGHLQALRTAHPAQLEFNLRRILGSGDLWITEYCIYYDGDPVHVVSVMEFRDGLVTRETHHFADPFEPPEWRARWVELM